MPDTKGQTIIELLLAMAFAMIMIPALFVMFFVSREGKPQAQQRTRAVSLVVEAEEAIRSIREAGWAQFAAFQNGTPYYPRVSGGRWTLTQGEEITDGLTRAIVFSDVYRDTSGSIVSSGGTRDGSTRRAEVTVSWLTPFPASVRHYVYLTRHTNIIAVDTTEADFGAGVATDVTVTNLYGGAVVLGATGGYGDWCQPSLTISALDLPKSGVANAISAIEGHIVAGTGENASGVSFANVLISDPPYPTNPTASVSGTFDGYKTNDVFTESSYAYIATDNNAKEIVILDVTQTNANGKYLEVGYFNMPGNGNGNAIVTAGNVGYMLDGGSKMYTVDLAVKTGSRPSLDADGVTLAGGGKKLAVVGTRAFVAVDAINAQLTIVDISNPSNLVISRQIGLPAQEARAVYVNTSGTRAYVVTEQSPTQRELFIVNTDTNSAAFGTVLGSYDTNGMDPRGVVVVSGPRAIVVGRNAEEYQVVDITNEVSSPLPRCGGLNVDTGIQGIATVFTGAERAYSYIVTGDATTELKIIEGGPGGSGSTYRLSGTFESRIFDSTVVATGSSEAAWNRISGNITTPSSGTVLTVQVAAADPLGGSCTGVSYAYVGPDGTSNTRYTSDGGTTIAGIIPFSDDGTGFENPARCFRYRAALSTDDQTLTPILYDVSVSLSP